MEIIHAVGSKSRLHDARLRCQQVHLDGNGGLRHFGRVNRIGTFAALGASHLALAWAGYSWASKAATRHLPPAIGAPPSSSQESRLVGTKPLGQQTDFAKLMAARFESKRLRDAPETRACYAAWLEQDSVAAIRWLASTRQWLYDNEILAFLKAHGDDELLRIINTAPEADAALVHVYPRWMKGRQPAELVSVAARIKDSPSRIDFIQWCWWDDHPTLIRLLPDFRKLLDDRGTVELLQCLINTTRMPLLELAEAAARTGFPDEAVKFVREAAARLEPGPSIQEMLAHPKPSDRTWRDELFGTIRSRCVAWSEWRADFAERGLAADVIADRVLRTEPELAQHPQILDRFVFATLVGADPVKATEWLKSRGSDWPQVFVDTMKDAPAEVRVEHLCDLAGMIDDPEAAEQLEQSIASRFSGWFFSDPHNGLAAIDKLADGSRRDAVLYQILEVPNWSHNPFRAAMVEMIRDPALRTAAAERIKKNP